MNKMKLVSLDQLGDALSRLPGMPEAIAAERAALQAGEFVETTRVLAGLTQTALAKRLGITQSRISQIEKGEGRYGASIVLLSRIAAACGGRLHLAFVPDEANAADVAEQSGEAAAVTEQTRESYSAWERS